MRIDPAKVAADARFDGKPVPGNQHQASGGGVALQPKRLLLIQDFFFHQWDATIRGHLFRSFPALVVFDELRRHLTARGFTWRGRTLSGP